MAERNTWLTVVRRDDERRCVLLGPKWQRISREWHYRQQCGARPRALSIAQLVAGRFTRVALRGTARRWFRRRRSTGFSWLG